MPLEKLRVFISWSGDRSRKLAEALRDWLPDVLGLVEPFLSSQDIDKGAKWRQVVSGMLEKTDLAVICLTPENLNSPWLLFEAGAVAKHTDSRVWTYLFGLEYTDVKDPLSEFQHTVANQKEDTKKLVAAINHCLDEGQLPQERFDKAFEKWWPELAEKVKAIPDRSPRSVVRDPVKKILEMTTEMLERIRESSRRPGVAADDVYDDDDRVSIESIVMSVLAEEIRAAGIGYKSIGHRFDGAYALTQADKVWRIEKRTAEDLALGRLTLQELLAASVQEKNPGMPENSGKDPANEVSRKHKGPASGRAKKKSAS